MSLNIYNITSLIHQEQEGSNNYESPDNSLREWESGYSDEDIEKWEIPEEIDTGSDIYDEMDIVDGETLSSDEEVDLSNENDLEKEVQDSIVISEVSPDEEGSLENEENYGNQNNDENQEIVENQDNYENQENVENQDNDGNQDNNENQESDKTTVIPERTDTNSGGICFDENVLAEFLKYMNLKGSRSSAFDREKYDEYCSILRLGGFTQQRQSLKKRAKDNYVTKCRRIMENYALYDGKLFKNGTSYLIPVVLIEDAAAFVEKIHNELLHSGERKTWDSLHPFAHGISFKDVSWLLARCQICAPMRANYTKSRTVPIDPIDPIITRFPFERLHLSLIDFTNEPSNGFKWILHINDLFTNMTWLKPLKLKHSVGIAKYLDLLMRHCGVPKMIQSENGQLFKGAFTRLIRKRGSIRVKGHPRGITEKGHRIIQKRIADWKKENNRTDWDNCVKRVAREINMSTCEILPKNMTPYEAMYGNKRRPHRQELQAKFSVSFDEIRDAISGRDINVNRGESSEAME